MIRRRSRVQKYGKSNCKFSFYKTLKNVKGTSVRQRGRRTARCNPLATTPRRLLRLRRRSQQTSCTVRQPEPANFAQRPLGGHCVRRSRPGSNQLACQHVASGFRHSRATAKPSPPPAGIRNNTFPATSNAIPFFLSCNIPQLLFNGLIHFIT